MLSFSLGLCFSETPSAMHRKSKKSTQTKVEKRREATFGHEELRGNNKDMKIINNAQDHKNIN